MLASPAAKELRDLLGELVNGQLGADDMRRLDEILWTYPELQAFYDDFMTLHSMLLWASGPPLSATPPPTGPVSAINPLSQATATPPSSPFDFLGSTIHGTVGYAFQAWSLAYLAAAALLGIGLLIGSLIHVSRLEQVANRSLPSARPVPDAKVESVGQITGMVDCVWADRTSETFEHASVPLGRSYALASGLMKITYNTGAKVILEGPATYGVESTSGGYLSLGRLTARVEKRADGGGRMADGDVGSGQWPVDGKSEIRNPKSETSNPQSLIRNPSLFSIRTPTAIVTDLGTEFGVEVDEDGATESHVKQGEVDVRIVDAQDRDKKHERVTAGNAIRIEPKSEKFVAVPYSAGRFADWRRSKPDSREDAYIQAVLADKPLGYWPLNEPAGSRKFLDRSGNGFHGFAMGTVHAGQSGPLPGPSRAIGLDGNGYIDVGRNDRFALANNVTVEAWIWIEPASGLRPFLGPIIAAGSGESRYQQSGWLLMCRTRSQIEAGSDSRQIVCIFGCYSKENAPILDSEMPLARWAHLIYVFGADNARLYVDGRPSAIRLACKPAKLGPTWVSIGWDSNLGGQYWQGRLAHIAVYPRVLSEQQIQNHCRLEHAK